MENTLNQQKGVEIFVQNKVSRRLNLGRAPVLCGKNFLGVNKAAKEDPVSFYRFVLWKKGFSSPFSSLPNKLRRGELTSIEL